MRALRARLPPPLTAASLRLVAVLVACAAGGALIGRSLSNETGVQEASGGAHTVSSGRIALVLPAGWSPAPDAPRLPGFPSDGRVAAVLHAPRIYAVAALLEPTSPSLLPAPLRGGPAAPPPRPTVIRVGRGLMAYQYSHLTIPGPGSVADVTVAPTTAGVATVACVTRPEAAPLLSTCTSVARSVSVAGAQPVELDGTTAFRMRLGPVLARLDAARRRERPAAEDGDPAAISRLAAAHGQASAALTRVAPAAPARARSIVREVSVQARAYAALADALRRKDGAAATGARARIRAAETRLEALLRCTGARVGSCAMTQR